MVSFYSRFVENLSTIAEPLYNLLKNDTVFKWTEIGDRSMRRVKEEIVSDRILVHYNPDLPLILSVDASPIGLGAVLSHQIQDGERPIAFTSRTLNKSERNYSQLDKEALEIKWGVEKFFNYIYGREFTLNTDHRTLIHIFGNKNGLPVHTIATRLLHYALYLQMFQFNIQYVPSEQHGNANFLSRLPASSQELFQEEENHLDEISLFQLEKINTLPITCHDIRKGTREDPNLLEILDKLQKGVSVGANTHSMSLHNGVIFCGSRVYIPSKYRRLILQELHSGHLGIQKMKALAHSLVYWPNINEDIGNTCNNCSNCINTQNNPGKVQTHFWEYPYHPWERIHVDFAGPFMGHIFFIVVDAHSKWIEVEIVNNTSARSAILILEKLFCRYGFPCTLVSDNASAFTCADFQHFIEL
ncbi:uncharacterized protein K02A2.6-like [Nilaparvata lugens]|uniref:uncharacterized protein K02A2.6-like n=1 Tax=Nilaparvata lugens TaxID=108931 RepID=UPI00193C8F86|nr:uncharacterized protein K02A2.6-like [Nilaparvata lugens]